jgi:hypothetical protein
VFHKEGRKVASQKSRILRVSAQTYCRLLYPYQALRVPASLACNTLTSNLNPYYSSRYRAKGLYSSCLIENVKVGEQPYTYIIAEPSIMSLMLSLYLNQYTLTDS